MPKEFVIDLFCGAGGTSTGVHLANGDSQVIACVNHDEKALESHRMNHPKARHYREDIRNPEVVFLLFILASALRKKYPDCIITIWASLECTNFSKAKGGLPRDADSRTLAESLFMYLEWLNPDYLMIENVIEFMCWGPLDENGKPVSKRRGRDYLNWIQTVQDHGYKFDWKELNSADFGAYTSRSRYFAQFAKTGLPIAWPVKTHAKNPSKEKDLFDSPLKKWKPVKEVLNLENEGVSIFGRKKPLVENTLKRIYAGLVKFVANGDDSFIKKYYSGRPMGKVISVNGPAGTVTTADGQSLVKCDFLLKYNSTNKNGKHVPPGIDEPCPTVAAQSRLGIVNANFLQSYYGNGQAHSAEEPCPTVPTKDRFAKIAPQFLVNSYNGGGKISDIQGFQNKGRGLEEPAPTILASRKHHYLMNPQFKGLFTCEHGDGFLIPVYKEDCETMIKIKQFMAYFGIVDIKMRMLEVQELLRIQGFPEGYQLVGNQTDQKKFIGNSVEVTTAKAIFEAHHEALVEYFEKQELKVA